MVYLASLAVDVKGYKVMYKDDMGGRSLSLV